MIAPDWVTNASLPGLAPRWREGRVQAAARHQDAEAVGADDAQQMRPRRVQHRLLERRSALCAALAESLR